MEKTTDSAITTTAFYLIVSGCGGSSESTSGSAEKASAADGNAPAVKKTFVFGDTTFNAENEGPNVNPHYAYAGWACIRYGVGETLVQIDDSMELQPWIVESYELVDELTWKIPLKDGVCFSNGNACDAAEDPVTFLAA